MDEYIVRIVFYCFLICGIAFVNFAIALIGGTYYLRIRKNEWKIWNSIKLFFEYCFMSLGTGQIIFAFMYKVTQNIDINFWKSFACKTFFLNTISFILAIVIFKISMYIKEEIKQRMEDRRRKKELEENPLRII